MSEQQVNIFEQASRLKLRFQTAKGLLTTEDLWHLSLEELNTVAIALNKQVKESTEISFIEVKSKANELLELKFEIAKRVINVKLEEKQQRELAAELQRQKQKLLELISEKEEGALKELPVEELRKRLASL
jgi:hypothetical protein